MADAVYPVSSSVHFHQLAAPARGPPLLAGDWNTAAQLLHGSHTLLGLQQAKQRACNVQGRRQHQEVFMCSILKAERKYNKQ